jgi:DNA-binding LacI/PurR family transcriptional regulator
MIGFGSSFDAPHDVGVLLTRIAEVAKKAGVSVATVSRALSKPEMVAAETRALIEQVADDLGYSPNLVARNLRKGTSKTLGLIVTDILNPFHATVAKGVQDTAYRHGYSVFLCNTDEDPAKEREYLQLFAGQQLRGLIIVPTERTKTNLKIVKGFPVVEFDRSSGTPGAHVVVSENREGARAAVQHLIQAGHKRIGMVSGGKSLTTAIERLEGYREALEAAGIEADVHLIEPGNHREDGGFEAAKKLLTLPKSKRPTAIFAANNEMTVGAFKAARELELRVPDDLSLVGFDDSRWAQTVEPAITVIEQPTYEMATFACDLLLQVLSGRDAPPTVVQYPNRLIERDSVGPPRH